MQNSNKFRLLHSQDAEEVIIWSCSDSSEDEDLHVDTLCNITNRSRIKRKRVNKKKSDVKNISNLEIAIVESPKRMNNDSESTSPILGGNCSQKSPVIPASQRFLRVYKQNSVASTRNTGSLKRQASPKAQNELAKSPVIILKCLSPKISPNVKKKLFLDSPRTPAPRSKSPILSQKSGTKQRKGIHTKTNENRDKNHNKTDSCTDFNLEESIVPRCNSVSILNKDNTNSYIKNKSIEKDVETILISSSSSSSPKDNNIAWKTNPEVVAKVKSYFDSCFSSETTSQHSISEYETPTPKDTSKSSDNIDIVSSITNVRPFSSSILQEDTATDFESQEDTKKMVVPSAWKQF